jgi:hypothetical protein
MGPQWTLQAFNMDSYWTGGGDLLGGVIALVILPFPLGERIGGWQARCAGDCLVLLALSVLAVRCPGSGSAIPNL